MSNPWDPVPSRWPNLPPAKDGGFAIVSSFNASRSVTTSIPCPRATNGQLIVSVGATRLNNDAWAEPMLIIKEAWAGFTAAEWPSMAKLVPMLFAEYERQFPGNR